MRDDHRRPNQLLKRPRPSLRETNSVHEIRHHHIDIHNHRELNNARNRYLERPELVDHLSQRTQLTGVKSCSCCLHLTLLPKKPALQSSQYSWRCLLTAYLGQCAYESALTRLGGHAPPGLVIGVTGRSHAARGRLSQ